MPRRQEVACVSRGLASCASADRSCKERVLILPVNSRTGTGLAAAAFVTCGVAKSSRAESCRRLGPHGLASSPRARSLWECFAVPHYMPDGVRLFPFLIAIVLSGSSGVSSVDGDKKTANKGFLSWVGFPPVMTAGRQAGSLAELASPLTRDGFKCSDARVRHTASRYVTDFSTKKLLHSRIFALAFAFPIGTRSPTKIPHTPVQSLACRGDGAIIERGSIAIIAPAPLSPIRESSSSKLPDTGKIPNDAITVWLMNLYCQILTRWKIQKLPLTSRVPPFGSPRSPDPTPSEFYLCSHVKHWCTTLLCITENSLRPAFVQHSKPSRTRRPSSMMYSATCCGAAVYASNTEETILSRCCTLSPYPGFEPRASRTPDRWHTNLLRHGRSAVYLFIATDDKSRVELKDFNGS
ncbi:hypothetical protein PR048_003443 [Dryococelus australis]|uniref:Uncharacterized protein n=1 Tax=Dryococelus australis TaxID=614101 RepID=A0ABQ9IN13_9NEOP|nr:hypothetical protein PR048_003443 [Dryococelus australis]